MEVTAHECNLALTSVKGTDCAIIYLCLEIFVIS